MRTALAVLSALALVPAAARADIPPPVPPAKDVKFVVVVDENAKAPKLIVPANMTRAQPFRPRGPERPPAGAVPPGKEPVAYSEFGYEDDGVAPAPRNDHHLMIAGLALTLAVGLGGVWLVRRPGRPATRGLALLAAVGGVLAVATVVWANAAAPKLPAPPAPPVGALPVAVEGNVTLEITQGGDTIRLVLDKATYEKMKKAPGDK